MDANAEKQGQIEASIKTPNVRPSNYFQGLFYGRISRLTFFLGYLFVGVMTFILYFFIGFLLAMVSDAVNGDSRSFLGSPWLNLIAIPTIFMNISLSVKRFHDVGHDGSSVVLLLIPFVNIFYSFWLIFKQGEQSENQYGPKPPLLDFKAFIGK